MLPDPNLNVEVFKRVEEDSHRGRCVSKEMHIEENMRRRYASKMFVEVRVDVQV